MNNKNTFIIVSTQVYKEKDALVRMISEDGTSISMIAKGTTSPTSKYGALLQPFNICEVDYHLKDNLSFFMSASLKKSIVFEDFNALAAASFLLQSMEAINRLDSSSYTLWTIVDYLMLCQSSPIAAMTKWCLDTLKLDGREMMMDECVVCGSLHISSFSLSAGGFCCKRCSTKEKVDLSDIEVLRALRCLAKAPLDLAYKCTFHALTMNVVKILVYELKDSYPLAMKSWKFMDELV
jgi:DNA repair protein RecO (recombination protein O)